MDENSTTAPQDNPDESPKDNSQDPGTGATDTQTDDTPKGGDDDNLDSSKSTDDSADDDKKSTTGEEGDDSTSKFDTDLDEWAEKTGRAKPESDRERELYQEIRDGQREYSRSKQKDAEKSMNKAVQDAKPDDDNQEDDDDGRDPVEKRQDELEAQVQEERNLRLRSEYFNDNSVTVEESDVMGEILKEKTDKGGKAAFDYWTHPDQLADLHQLAKARMVTSQDTTAIEEEAARKERARIAKQQQASGPSRNASTQTSSNKDGYDRTEFLKSDD